VWGHDFGGDGSTVHTHVKNLRAKLPENIIFLRSWTLGV
jgi:two-component system response regulator VanR